MGQILTNFNQDMKTGRLPTRTAAASKWFNSLVKPLMSGKYDDLQPGKRRKTDPNYDSAKPRQINPSASPVPGTLQLFYYDAKWKHELPYWDRLPLVLPIEMYGDSFLGINLHYLPPNLRVQLLDALLDLTVDKAITPTARIQASYGILSGASRFKSFRPCIKKYLFSHVQSAFMAIEPDGWEKAVAMPVATFQKAGMSRVWADSRRMI